MYLDPFENDYPEHDFTLIADAIKEYFPIDQPERLTSETVAASPGFNKIGAIAKREFMNEQAYRDKWGKLTSHLKEVLKRPVSGYPDLASGGFLGEVIFEENESPDFIRQKTIQFHVSIIGPFFSIRAVDSSIISLEIESIMGSSDKGHYDAKHAVTVSPVFEYQEVFSTLESELRSFFPGYQFVPYHIGMSTISNISLANEYQDRDPRLMDTVYEALFGRGAVHGCETRGDRRYGMDDWLKPLNEDEKSLLDVISQNIGSASTVITIHKVWKLQEAKLLDTFPRSGHTMFGMDLFDIIDLTDPSSMIMASDKRGAPESAAYKIKDDVIDVSSNFSLRIVALSQETLTLNLILHFDNEGVSVNGEMLQMQLVQLKSL